MADEQKEISETKKPERKKGLSRSRLRQIFKDNGAVRISKDALDEVDLVLTEIVEDIATRSTELAGHAKRETVRREDIRLAAK